MKHYILLHFLLFISLLSFSQKNGTITYSYKILEDEKIIKNEIIGPQFLKTIEAAKNLKFELKFNDSISEFKYVNNLNLDGQNLDLALSISGAKKEIYNYKENIYHNNSDGIFKENEYLIIEPLNKNWQLTNESKVIDGYTCYKATNEYIVDNGKVFKHPVIAWYCPQIPISFGPKGYGGLPGLILELQEWNNVFGVEKIVISNISKEIKLPKTGKAISNQDYQNQIAKLIKKQFEEN